jgi:hypothetical protein
MFNQGFLSRPDSPKYVPNRIEDEFFEEPNNEFKEFLRRQ